VRSHRHVYQIALAQVYLGNAAGSLHHHRIVNHLPPVEGALPGVAEDSLEAYELAAIRNALRKNDENRKKAAQMLGIDRKTLRLKIRRYGLLEDKPSTGK